MNNTSLAIQKAVEGGWGGDDIAFGVDKTAEPVKDCWKVNGWWYTKEIFLDPLFFQALGKTQGFNPKSRQKGHIMLWSPTGYALDKKITWGEYTQHRLIDAIQQGRSIDEFFGEILKK